MDSFYIKKPEGYMWDRLECERNRKRAQHPFCYRFKSSKPLGIFFSSNIIFTYQQHNEKGNTNNSFFWMGNLKA